MIAVMSGLQDEIQKLVESITVVEQKKALDRTIYCGEFEGQKTFVVGSGVGKVRASAFAQHLIDRYDVKSMIVFGLAGALDTSLAIGDVVVSRDAVMHDYDVAGEGVNENIAIGPIRADPRLMELALHAGRRVACGEEVRLGTILTGDVAVASTERRMALRDQFGGDCVEMEGAAAALVCALNEIPFVIVRTISDLADELAHKQFEATFARTSSRSADVVLEMLRMMSQSIAE